MVHRGILLCCAVLIIAPVAAVVAQPKTELETLCYPAGTEDKLLADRKIAACSELLRANPQNAEFYFYRSTAKQFKGDYKSAVDDLTQAINLSTTRAIYYRALRLQLYLDRLDDLKSALEDANYLVSISKSKDDEIHFRTARAEVYFGLGRHPDAREDVTRILELDPANVYAQDMLEMIKLQEKLRR